MNRRKHGMIAGVGLGLVAFVFVGLLPSIFTGGYFGVRLATAVVGEPLDQSGVARALVLGGMISGPLVVAAFFSALGAAMGWVLLGHARFLGRSGGAEDPARSEICFESPEPRGVERVQPLEFRVARRVDPLEMDEGLRWEGLKDQMGVSDEAGRARRRQSVAALR